MVVLSGSSSASLDIECPVMKAWLELEEVVGRAATAGKIALCRHNDLGRSSVDDNYEILAPLLTEYGSSPANMKSQVCVIDPVFSQYPCGTP